MTAVHYLRCLRGIVVREALRFLHQRGRFIAALVRPLVWLFIFAAGFRLVLGVSIIPPYETYVLYEVYIITPGLIGMIQLFNGMQSSLSMVYDREMGSMKTLLVSPLPRWYLLTCKLLAGVAVSILQVYAFLIVAAFWEIDVPLLGYVSLLPALVLSGLMLGALGMLLSSVIKQLENFAGVMNFVIFPMFFASSTLYPLWKIKESSLILYTDIPHIPSKFVEIVPLSHRQGNCIPYAAIRWHDFGNRPALGRPLGHFSRHPDTPLLSLSPRRRFPRPTPERVFVADHQSSSGFSGTGPSAPPPQPIGT